MLKPVRKSKSPDLFAEMPDRNLFPDSPLKTTKDTPPDDWPMDLFPSFGDENNHLMANQSTPTHPPHPQSPLSSSAHTTGHSTKPARGVKPPCGQNCKLLCSSISHIQREKLFKDYYNLESTEQKRMYIALSIEEVVPKFRSLNLAAD